MEILVPIFVCVVLPVSIVLIISLQKRNSDNRRAQILLKAIEANKDLDVDRLTDAMSNGRVVMTPRELRNRRLLRGCMFTLVGIVLVTLGLCLKIDGMDLDYDSVFVPVMLGGCSLAVGVSYLIVYYVTRNQKD
ncbi:MAG: hypothetical protein K2K84_09860 [Muribaculaceae bacterium]|nr:hypothetical protein [Muribaculaceae bacterium]